MYPIRQKGKCSRTGIAKFTLEGISVFPGLRDIDPTVVLVHSCVEGFVPACVVQVSHR